MQIKRRRFGKTNLMVTELSFGAMNLRKLETVKQAYEILNYVLDKGINLIDTARAYNGENGEGVLVESEALVGKVVAERTDLKEPIVIITKGHAYTPEAFREELSTSLQKLGVKGQGNLKIGSNDIKLVYFFHGINKDRWATIQNSGALKTAQEYKEKGIINYIGFSSHYGDEVEIRAAIDTGVFDVAELPYNIYNRTLGEPEADNVLKYAYDHDLGIVNMKAFGGNSMPPIFKMLEKYITMDYNAMLRFCVANPYISTIDAGAKYVYEFLADMEAVQQGPLSKDMESKYIEEADKVSRLLKDFCRDCRHCQEKFECVQGIDFPTILVQYSRYQVSKSLGNDLDEFYENYKSLKLNASDCIECGQCEPWCEYKLGIRELLKKAHEELSRA